MWGGRGECSHGRSAGEEQELLAGKSRILMMVLMIIVIAAAMLCSGILSDRLRKF